MEKRVRELLRKTDDDENLTNLIMSLEPEQRLVNILFDEVKLVSAIWYSALHVIGMAANEPDYLATHALRWPSNSYFITEVLRIIPVTKLKAKDDSDRATKICIANCTHRG